MWKCRLVEEAQRKNVSALWAMSKVTLPVTQHLLHLQRPDHVSFLLRITSFTLTKSNLLFPFSLSLHILIHTHNIITSSLIYWMLKQFVTDLIWVVDAGICHHVSGKLWPICMRNNFSISSARMESSFTDLGDNCTLEESDINIYTRGQNNSGKDTKYPVGIIYLKMILSKNNYSKLILSVPCDEKLKQLASTGFSSSCLYLFFSSKSG